jgi:hypothetical protein
MVAAINPFWPGSPSYTVGQMLSNCSISENTSC